MNRSELLHYCATITDERQGQYGSPKDDFRVVAAFLNIYLHGTGKLAPDQDIDEVDVAMIMDLMKTARFMTSRKFDTIADKIGYCGCAAEILFEDVSISDLEKDPKFHLSPKVVTRDMIAKENEDD